MGDPETARASIERFIALSDIVKVSDEDIDWLTGGASIDEVVAGLPVSRAPPA